MRMKEGGKRGEGKRDIPIKKVDRDAEIVRHAAQTYDPVALKQLLISPQAHLAHEPGAVFVEVAVLAEEILFDGGEGEEEGLVVAVVETSDEAC